MAVAVGMGFTVVLTEDGSVCTFGQNNVGQLGVGHSRPMCGPTILDNLQNFGGQDVVMVAASYKNSACVSADGAVWTWGDNSCGQLGRDGHIPFSHTPGRLDPVLFGRSPAQMVSCGPCYILILNSLGEVWACGLNYCGQLGLGHQNNEGVFMRINPDCFGGTPVTMIACGWFHSIALVRGGRELFGWGWNAFGPLGVGVGISASTDLHDPIRCAHYWVPTRSNTAAALGEAKIVFISAGNDLTMVVSDSGDLWGCGNGRHNALGLGDDAVHLQFQRVGGETRFGSGGVRMVSCGNQYSLIVGKNGSVWSCGSGSYGALGTEMMSSDGVRQRDNAQPILLNRAMLCDSNVVVVAAGQHSVAATAHGRLCLWGNCHGATPAGTPPVTRWMPTALCIQRLHGARIGRWHDAPAEMQLAFAMCTHDELTVVGGRTALCGIKEDLLRHLCDLMRFAPREGASQALRHLLGIL